MNIVAVTQARTGSSRFPKKILSKVGNQSLLELHIKRIQKSKKIDKIIIATTENSEDDIIENEAKRLKVGCFRGSEYDVLDRFYKSVKNINPDYIVRLTSDCPLIDSHLIDTVIEKTINFHFDYCSNTLIESYPDGQDIEIFNFKSLKISWEKAKLNSEREHVTPYIKNNPKIFKIFNVHSGYMKYRDVRMTVDEPQDLIVIQKLIELLGDNNSWINYARLYLDSEEIRNLNNKIIRNEGYLLSKNND